MGGPTGWTETALAFIAFCPTPQHSVPLALLFATACRITTVSRMLAAVKGFRD